MDSHELFRQLTHGVKFTKKNIPPRKDSTKHSIKLEEQNNIKVEGIAADEYETSKEMEEESITTENLQGKQNEMVNYEQTFKLMSGVESISKKSKKKPNLLTNVKERVLEEEIAQTIRKENCIKVLGKNIPPPFTKFEELHTNNNMSEKLVQTLINCNYEQPTAIQMQAIPIMLKGRSLMACAPTGSGKTVAYLVPVINALKAPKKLGFRALILAPTRELAQQIYRQCIRLSEKTALKIHIISKVNHATESSLKKFDILISTPNSVRFLLQQQPTVLNLKSVEWLILDEADRLMEEGKNNFKEQLDDILSACTNPLKKLALFSATYTVPVAKWALRNLKKLARVNVGGRNAATEFVEQELLFVGSESGKLLAVRDMVRNGLKPPVLVFVQSKDRAKQLFQELLYDGINVDIIHADRTQQQRNNCVRVFREGHVWVLICTDLMGRGIDFKGVNLVINYDFPPSTISYIHRIGRTGRAGRPGKAITFFTQDDTPHLRSIAEIIKNSGGKVPEFMLNMKKAKKSEQKKLPEYRNDISTKIKPNQDKLERGLKNKKYVEANNKTLKKSTGNQKYERTSTSGNTKQRTNKEKYTKKM